MIYRKFGQTDIQLSQLGFGAMRFPLTEEYEPTKIDEAKATEMLYHAIDQGVNIIDTAYPYHRQMSEVFLGKALTGPRRDKVHLSTKLPVWLVKSKDDPQKYLEEQLQRLQTDTIDLYLLHGLNEHSWKTVQENEILDGLDRMLRAGKIRYAGFSFHDALPLFKEIADAYPWTFCLIQLNYVDDREQAGVEGLGYAHEKGMGVMVMEPLRGGKLANRVPHDVLETIKRSRWDETPAQFALRWLWNLPEVACVLSGMSALEHLKENIRFAGVDHVGTLKEKDLQLYKRAKEIYTSRTKVKCAHCGYCQPCAQHVSIPYILELYNDACMFDALVDSRWCYRVFVKPENRADQCTECGECEEKCPQHIPIMETLKTAHEALTITGGER